MSSDESDDVQANLNCIRDLNNVEHDWLDENYRTEFLAKIGRRGKVDGSAAEYTRNTVVPNFLSEYYPNATEKERADLFKDAYKKIYAYLINGKRPGAGRKKKKSKAARVDVTNLWVDDNPATKAKLLEEYRKENGLDENASIAVDIRRKLVCDAFRSLPKEVKRAYEARASELREEMVKNKVLQGNERLEYAHNVPKLLKSFIREVEEQGVIITANVAYQIDEAGTMEITSVGSDRAKDYKNTDGHADSVAAFAEWLRKEGKRVKQDIPAAMAYPDRHNECLPLIPDIDYDQPPPVPILRRIVRTACSAINQRLGGNPQLPWKDIQLAQMKGDFSFIDRQRMPPDYPLIDPSVMTREYAIAWVKWLARPQKKEADPSTWFVPKIVYTTSLNISLVRNDAVSKRKVTKGGTEVWELMYDGWVDKCQRGGNIKYPEDSREYEEHLKQLERNSISRPHLLGLPCRSNYAPTLAVSDSIIGFIKELTDPLPDSDKEAINGLLRGLNKMYALLPAETDNGIWDSSEGSLRQAVGLPSLFPIDSTKLSAPKTIISTWVPSEYFAPPIDDVPASSTISFFEKWQHWALYKGFLRHSESQTLYGGTTGTLSVVLGILKLLFSIGAVLGKLQLPTPRPNDIRAPRITQADWDLCLTWCRNWQSSIEDTITILTKTFAERASQQGEDAQIYGGAGPTPPVAASTPTQAAKLSRRHTRERTTSIPDLSVDSQGAGPSLPRPRPRPAYHIPTADHGVDDDARSFSSSEGDRSDNYKQPNESDSESERDIEDEGGSSNKRSLKSMGKQPVRDANFSMRKSFTSIAPALETGRDEYEREKGSGFPLEPRGLVPDVPLVSHPLGVLLAPRTTPDWSGSIHGLVKECRSVEKEAKVALTGFFGVSIAGFRPEDATLAITDALSSLVSNEDKLSLVVLNAQRLVWNRAKDMWPTIQYQYRLFSELSRKLSRFLVTVHNKHKSAPEGIVVDLKTHLKVLTRLSYQVRFVYQELHDLGMISKEFFDTLPQSWYDPNCKLTSEELSGTADRIRAWGAKASQVIEYHAQSRQKTWEHSKMNVVKYPVPMAVWFRFGNPPSCTEIDNMITILKLKMDSVLGETNLLDPTKKDAVNDMEIDSVSPSEEDRQAQRLLHGDEASVIVEHGGQGASTDGQEQFPAGEDGDAAKGAAIQGSTDTRRGRLHGVAGENEDDGQLDREDPSELAGHSKPTQTRRSVGAKANKKRKSNPSSSKATEQTKPKRSRPAKESIASGRRSSGGVGEMTTRSGRTVKVSEKAKSG